MFFVQAGEPGQFLISEVTNMYRKLHLLIFPLNYPSCDAHSDILNEIPKLLLPAGYFLRLAGLFTQSLGNLGHRGHTCAVSETELELHSGTNQPQRPTPE